MFGLLPYGCQAFGNITTRIWTRILEFLNLESWISKTIEVQSFITLSLSIASAVSKEFSELSLVTLSVSLESTASKEVDIGED